MALDHYDIGDPVVRTAAFTVGGVATDPTTITAKTKDPAGTVTTYVYGVAPELTKVSVGNYKLTLSSVTVAGQWSYQFVGTGTASGTETGEWVVDPDVFAGSLVADYALTTVPAAELYLNRMGQGGSLGAEREDRAWIASLINQASAAIARYCEREFKPQVADATRVFRYDGSGFLSMAPSELRTVVSITLYTDQATSSQLVLAAQTASVASDYRLEPRELSNTGTYLWLTMPKLAPVGDYQVSVRGAWGATLVPADVERACLVTVKNWYMNPGEFSGASMMGENVTEQFEQGAPAEQGLPIAVRGLLTPYRRR